MAFGLALLMAGFFEQAGLAMIVGAYVMGLCLSKTDIAFALQRSLGGLYDFLVPVFFVVMGMLVDIRVLADFHVLKFGLIYSVLAILAKIIGCGLPAYFMNFNLLGATRIGIGMIPRGEVALIIAGIGATTMMTVDGVSVPIIDARLFGITIIMTLLTTLVAPPLLAYVLSIPGRGVKKEVDDVSLVYTKFVLPSEFVRDFILRALIDNLRMDGFRHSEVDRDGGIIQFRKESTTFSLHVHGNELEFESNMNEVMLLKTAVYETFLELNKTLADLKTTRPLGMDEAMVHGAKQDQVEVKAKKPINIDRIVTPDCILSDLKAQNTTDAIKELVQALAWAGRLADPELCLQDVLAREAMVSTSFSEGVALPHARTTGVNELVAAIGISREGCPEADDDDTKNKIFVLSLCPKQAEEPYLQFVAHVARILSDEKNIEKIVASKNAAEIHRLFSAKTAK